MKPHEVLEELAGLGLVDAECLSRGKLPWKFIVSGLAVKLSRAHEHEAMKVEVRGASCGLASIGVREERGVRAAVSTARAIQQVVGVFRKVEPPQRAALEVREVAGRRLYLARVAEKRHVLVLAATEEYARVFVKCEWGTLDGVQVDEATEAELGRHEEILTERGRFPAAEVLSMLARMG